MAIRSSPLASALALLAAVACTSSHHDKVCPRNEPAFRIQVTAGDGPLPVDTELTVTYSGTETESYSLAHGGVHNQDVCCRPGSPTNGALPDVPCGVPPVTPEASVGAPLRDAGAIHDARPPAIRVDAAAIADDVVPSLDGSSNISASLDATASSDATPPAFHDASLEDAGPRSDGAAPRYAAGPAAILCDLWTNGVAAVTVTATGYARMHPVLDDPFVPDPRCGVQTVDHRLILTQGDGGLLR